MVQVVELVTLLYFKKSQNKPPEFGKNLVPELTCHILRMPKNSICQSDTSNLLVS